MFVSVIIPNYMYSRQTCIKQVSFNISFNICFYNYSTKGGEPHKAGLFFVSIIIPQKEANPHKAGLFQYFFQYCFCNNS